MRLHLSCCIVLGLFLIAQLNHAGSKTLHEGELLALQLKAEELVEKIINFIQDIYEDMKGELKCVPDRVSEALMETLKDAIRCVEENEKDYSAGKIRNKTRAKNFLRCLTNGKREIRDKMESVDTTLDYCPDNVTEKTYQINVTTTFSNTFRISIKNGLEITKEIERNKGMAHDDEEDSTDEAQIEGSSKVDNDNKHRDTATGGNEGHRGIMETDQGKGLGKPRSSMDRNLTDDNNESNSTKGESSFDYNDNSNTENSTKKSSDGYHQWKHPEEEKRKIPNNNSDWSDYTDEYDPELRSSSTWDVSSDEMVQHLHPRFSREQDRYDGNFMPLKPSVSSDTLDHIHTIL